MICRGCPLVTGSAKTDVNTKYEQGLCECKLKGFSCRCLRLPDSPQGLNILAEDQLHLRALKNEVALGQLRGKISAELSAELLEGMGNTI